jgi:hypothetical protein
MLLIPCTFLQLTRQPINALNKIQFMTNINLLHVSELAWLPQGIFAFDRIQAQHANPVCITLTVMVKILRELKSINSMSIKLLCCNFMITDLRRVSSRKSQDLNYTATEACKRADATIEYSSFISLYLPGLCSYFSKNYISTISK